MEQARLEDVGSGLAPASPGWFVVNAGEAAWTRHDAFGGRCTFEAGPRVLAERPDLEPQRFPDVGITLAVLEPGKPSGLYQAKPGYDMATGLGSIRFGALNQLALRSGRR